MTGVQTCALPILLEYGQRQESEDAAVAGDYVTVNISFEHDGRIARDMSNLSVRLQPTLRFQDGEIEGFDQLMSGAVAGDTRSGKLVISRESSYVPMRGETLTANIKVRSVSKFQPAALDAALAERMGFDSVETLRDSVRNVLQRHVTYRQRQSCRTQLLEQITEAANWELPEELVMKQVENALHREILEMQQAGFTPTEIRGREAALRQKSVSVTRQAMKEHFVLDKIATVENIEVTEGDIDVEISAMAFQGSDGRTAYALNPMANERPEHFPADVRDLMAWVHGEPLVNNHPFAAVQAYPQGPTAPEMWILGSSDYGAQVAALFGLPYCYAWFFSDGAGGERAIDLYKRSYRPSARHPEPHCGLCVAALAAPTAEEAQYHLKIGRAHV